VIDICKMTILYVDADFDVSKMVIGQLKKNYPMQKILHAENPVEALRIISRCDPDIFLLDVLLPDLGGDEFALFLKRTFSTRPVVFISACRDPATIERCMASGACRFFAKPVNFGSLFETIDALLVQIFYRRFPQARRKPVPPVC